MNGPRPIVVKVGGSLLDWPPLPDRLAADLARRSGPFVLIVGGGDVADAIRRLDRDHAIGEGDSHRLALRALDLTARMLAAVLPGSTVLDRLDGLGPCWRAGSTPILAPRLVLDDDERTSPDPLPHTWSVTTDSIAARIAEIVGARELVLLKSTAPSGPGPTRIALAAASGLVDPWFPRAAARLPRVVARDLRDDAGGDHRLIG